MHPDPSDADVHAALASHTRRQVLEALARSSAPMDALTIAAELGLHVTTVRFHLDLLEEARLVRREPAAEKRRGRPRIRYVATAGVREESREQLIDVLAGALAQRDDGGRSQSIEAGRRWADDLAAEQQSTDDDVGALLEVLDGLGFDPLIDDSDVIALRACPFRAAAREHQQVVCSVHRGLVEQILESRGSVRHPNLLPFVEPELCLITLSRA